MLLAFAAFAPMIERLTVQSTANGTRYLPPDQPELP
jgi:hypothetical protein